MGVTKQNRLAVSNCLAAKRFISDFLLNL